MADFKNKPDYKGDAEISYGLSKEFKHQGYITETVEPLADGP